MENLYAQAQGVWKPLIVCGLTGPDDPAAAKHPCGYEDLILLANNVISDLIILATLIATVALIYAGFKLLTSGGNENAAKEAKEMLMKVVWGFLWILVAWVAVYTIMNTLLRPEINSVLRNPPQ